MQELVSPFRLVSIRDILIGNRFRKEIGEIKTLAKSIEEIGLLHPVVLNERFELIAGHRRIKAYEFLGRENIPAYIIPLKDIIKGEFHENAVRKDFTPSEIVAIKRTLEPEIKSKNRVGRPSKNSGKLPEFKGDTRDIIAKYVGVSGRQLEKTEKIVEAYEANPERFETLMENVDSGQTSIRYAYDVVSRAERHENPPPLPEDKHDVIYADPPWKYYYKARGNPEYHYPLMNDEDIYNLQVPSAKNSVLFLWATNPKLVEALKVIDSWGFTYKTNLVWVKDKIGTGFYVRGKHELLLIATKGSIPTPVNDTRPHSVFEAPRREHSRKPDGIYEVIESMYPNRKYLELFARNNRENWTSWGDEL